MARAVPRSAAALYVLGLLLALLAYVPLVGFVAPVVFGLAFIRYLLGALECALARYRAHPNKELAAREHRSLDSVHSFFERSSDVLAES